MSQQKIITTIIILITALVLIATVPLAMGAGKSLGYGNPDGVQAQADYAVAQAELVRAKGESWGSLTTLVSALPESIQQAGGLVVQLALAIVAVLLGIGVLFLLITLSRNIWVYGSIKYASAVRQEVVRDPVLLDKPRFGDSLGNPVRNLLDRFRTSEPPDGRAISTNIDSGDNGDYPGLGIDDDGDITNYVHFSG